MLDSLKNSGKKFLLFFNASCETDCSSKSFADFAAVWWHRRFSTNYVQHSLFHQSKLGRDVELQNTNFVLIKSRSDVMQVSTLSVQPGLESELVDWYPEAASFPKDDLLIDMSTWADDRVR